MLELKKLALTWLLASAIQITLLFLTNGIHHLWQMTDVTVVCSCHDSRNLSKNDRCYLLSVKNDGCHLLGKILVTFQSPNLNKGENSPVLLLTSIWNTDILPKVNKCELPWEQSRREFLGTKFSTTFYE